MSTALLLPVVGVMAAVDTGLNATANSAYGSGYATSTPGIPQLVGNVLTVIYSVLGVYLLLVYVYSGIEWIRSGGDSKLVTAAKTRITNATVGLLIVLAAYSLTNYVVGQLMATVIPAGQ